MADRALSLRRVVFLVMLMALAMIPSRAFAQDGQTYTLSYASGFEDKLIRDSNSSIIGSVLAMVSRGEDQSTVPAPTNLAVAGNTVSMVVRANTGYELKRMYYQADGGEEQSIEFEYTQMEDFEWYYTGSFSMPAANTVVGAELKKKTYTVSVDFGSEHAEFVQEYFAGKEDLEIDGAVVKLAVEHETTTPQGIAYILGNYVNDYISTHEDGDYVDGDELLMTSGPELLLGEHPRSIYTSENAYYSARSSTYGVPIEENTTLYALWAQPVGDFTLTLTTPKCGDTLSEESYSIYYYWKPYPYQSVDGCLHVLNEDHGSLPYSDWDMDTSTFMGGNSYQAHVCLEADWGYFFPDDFADNMTLAGGTYVESDMGGYSYRKLNVSIPVEHIVPEGTKELAPACTTGDSRTYHCSGCDQEITETAEALGHDWGELTYVWSDDNSVCTATRTCKRDEKHVETETAKATSKATATCTESGATTYTASFVNKAFEEQTKTVEAKALGHDWGEPTYTWSDDNSTCTATRTCTRKGCDGKETETAKATSKSTATCTQAGTTTYTATFTNKAFEEQTKSANVDALGHDWGEPMYVWSDDNSVCTAIRTCKRDTQHTETEAAKATSAITKEPTDTEEGERTYTATFTNTAFATQTKAVPIPAGEKGPEYYFESGENGEWTKGSNEALDFKIECKNPNASNWNHNVVGIFVDEKQLETKDYDLRFGSVIVSLKPEYLETLAVGEHTLTVEFPDGSVSTKFTVKEKDTEKDAEEDQEEETKKDSTKMTPTSTPAARTTSSGTSGTSRTAATPRTGDDNDGTFVSLLVGAALACLFGAKRIATQEN